MVRLPPLRLLAWSAAVVLGAFALWSIVLFVGVSRDRRSVEEGVALLSQIEQMSRSLDQLRAAAAPPGNVRPSRTEWEGASADVREELARLAAFSESWSVGGQVASLRDLLALADEKFHRALSNGVRPELSHELDRAAEEVRTLNASARSRMGAISRRLARSWKELYGLELVSLTLAVAFAASLFLLARAGRRLEESLRQHRLLAEAIEDVVSLHDAAGRIVHAGPGEGARRPSSLLGRPRGARGLAEDFHARAIALGQEISVFPWDRPDGSEGWLEVRVRVVDASPGAPIRWLCTSRDVTDRRRSAQQIERLAYHDALTGLPNRALLADRLGVALHASERDETEVAVLCLDLDRFRSINETAGPSVGDRLLQAVAARLAASLSVTDTLARTGGDEFSLVVPRPGDLRLLTRRVLTVFESPFDVGGHEISVGGTIGESLFPTDGDGADDLLRKAYVAMTKAKEKGRGTAVRWEPGMDDGEGERVALRGALSRALEREEFRLYYQPQVDLASGRITGMEALIRWSHPQRGMLAPSEFLFLLEEGGLIEPVGEWVLREACAQVGRWTAEGLVDLRVAVNLSPRQFLQPDLADRVRRILDEAAVEPSRLELEITEYAAMTNPDLANETLRGLERLGVHISLDDFGTGYSSLAYLKRFPIHTLKIDQSFVREVTVDADDAAIAKAIIGLAHSLGRRVVAEGVETEAQARFLEEAGCDEAQGYLLSRPLPPVEVIEKLRVHPIWPLREPAAGDGARISRLGRPPGQRA